MHFAFVIATRLHVETCAPLESSLRQLGDHKFTWVSLDEWYKWGGRGAIAEAGIQAIVIPGPASRFVHLPLPRMYFELLFNARKAIRTYLTDFRPDLLFIGNDRGLIEKELIRQAKLLGIKTVFIVEGIISRTEERRFNVKGIKNLSAREVFVNVVKELLSQLLRRLKKKHLAPTYMGEGGCDVIAAPGRAAERILAGRDTSSSQIHVTGLPRFDQSALSILGKNEIKALLKIHPGKKVISVFTSGFGTQHMHNMQKRQLELVNDIFKYVKSIYNGKVTVIHKPHPREPIEEYLRLAANNDDVRILPNQLPESILLSSDLAITPFSTIILDAAVANTPLVIADFVTGISSNWAVDIDEGRLPSCNSFAEIKPLIDAVASNTPSSPFEDYSRELLFRPGEGSSRKIADIALNLLKS